MVCYIALVTSSIMLLIKLFVAPVMTEMDRSEVQYDGYDRCINTERRGDSVSDTEFR